jgi:hypothetical protein
VLAGCLPLQKLLKPYEGNAPRFYKEDWRKLLSRRLFIEHEQISIHYPHIGASPEAIVDRILSVSFITALPFHEETKNLRPT